MSILMSLIQPVTKLLDKVIPDADAKQRIAHEIAVLAEKQAHELAKSQIEVNKAEAAHKNLFVAGWRPAVGWTCCLAMASNFLVIPMANFALALASSTIVFTVASAAWPSEVPSGSSRHGADEHGAKAFLTTALNIIATRSLNELFDDTIKIVVTPIRMV